MNPIEKALATADKVIAANAELERISTDRHGNKHAREGVDRCPCGAKYWENDRCASCGAAFKEESVTPRYTVEADEEELAVTVEAVYLSEQTHKVRIASSDNKTTHWFTVEQARQLATALGSAAAYAESASLREEQQLPEGDEVTDLHLPDGSCCEEEGVCHDPSCDYCAETRGD